jgi:Circularly permutated YpsA SLOG family
MPRGFLTEDGPRPDFAEEYVAVELASKDYKDGTRANVRDSDGTLWFGDFMSPGGRATLDACRFAPKPFLIVYRGATRPSAVVSWIEANGVRVLNVAGSRESKAPGIGARVERFVGEVLRQLARGRNGD